MNSLREGLYSPLLSVASRGTGTHKCFPNNNDIKYYLPIEKLYASTALRFFLRRHQVIKLRAKQFNPLARPGVFRDGFIESDLMLQLKKLARFPNAYSAIALGTPGPYNKQSVLLMDKTGEAISLSKVCSSIACRHLQENEIAWLGRLNNFPELQPHIPQLIFAVDIGNLLVVTQSVNSGKLSTRKLEHTHITFLGKLQESCSHSIQFMDSTMHTDMQSRTIRMEANLSLEWRKRINDGITLVEKKLSRITVPMVVAHRDFAPWNIRVTTNGLYVFDWEFASTEYIPLYDIFHFLLMPVALNRRLKSADVIRLIKTAVKFGEQLPDGKLITQSPEAQLLAYLIDLCLFYLESHDGKSGGDVVVKNYARLIDCSNVWCPA